MRQHTSRDHTVVHHAESDHTDTEHTAITPGLLRGWPVRNDRRETVLVVGGARTVPGAVVLTGTAALRVPARGPSSRPRTNATARRSGSPSRSPR
jgi:hypothetical protein